LPALNHSNPKRKGKQMKTVRRFYPANPDYRTTANTLGGVHHWEWTKRKGLICHTRNGLTWKSEWGTLPAFLKAVRERRETAIVERGEA